MRGFLQFLQRGQIHLGRVAGLRSLSMAVRWSPPPAILLTGLGFALGRLDCSLAALALLLPILVTWRRLGGPPSVPFTARTFDRDHSLRDLLTTANEFQMRESQSEVLKALMAEADHRARGLALPETPDPQRWERRILTSIFLMLLFANLWQARPRDLPGRTLAERVEEALGDDSLRQEVAAELEKLRQAETPAAAEQGSQALSRSLGEKNPGPDLRKLGDTLAKDPTTAGVGQELQNGDPAQAAEAAEAMARQMEQGLSPGQREQLRQTLSQAARQVEHPALQDLKQTLEGMPQQLDQPRDLGQSARDLARQLRQAAARQQAATAAQQACQKGAEKGGQQGQKPGDQSGNPGQNPGDQPGEGKNGQQPGEGDKGNGQGKGEGKGQGKGQGQGQQAQGAGQGSGKDQGKGAGKGSGQGGDQKQGTGPGGKGTGKGLGKGAGGTLTQDPKELLKNGRSKPPLPGQNRLDFKQADPGSSPQMIADFDPGTPLTAEELKRLQAREERVVKSREVDDFCRQQRVPPGCRDFLRGFFLPGGAP